MIEPIMYIAIGFLIACMLIIGLIPVVHARAVRLTTRRVEAITPMSMAEIQADKDQLRAEFAMSTRRLEMSVEQMKAKITSQLAELGKKDEMIGRIKLDLGEKAAALLALDAKDKQVVDELQETRRERDEKAAALEAVERELEETKGFLTAATTAANHSAQTVDSQRVELVTARAQIEVLKGQIDSLDKECRDLNERLTVETMASSASRQALIEETAKSEALANRVAELERQVVAQMTEAEGLGRRVQELLAQLDQQSHALAARDQAFAEETAKSEALANRVAELERQVVAQTTDAEVLGRHVQELLAQVDQQSHALAAQDRAPQLLYDDGAGAAQELVQDLRAQLAYLEERLRASEERQRTSSEAMQAERAIIAQELHQLKAERDKLQAEVAATKQDTEATSATERMENAVLRERINDVAAEVARLTSVLEGPASPIDTMLSGDGARSAPAPHAPGAGEGSNGSNGVGAKVSLADRMRALQSRAATQAPQARRA